MTLSFPFQKYNYMITVSKFGKFDVSEIHVYDPLLCHTVALGECDVSLLSGNTQASLMINSNILFKNGGNIDQKVLSWIKTADTDTQEVCEINIEMRYDEHKPNKTAWIMTGASPVRYRMSNFHELEFLEIAYESIVRC